MGKRKCRRVVDERIGSWNMSEASKITGLTENRRIEKARAPIRRRTKKARTFPKACLRLLSAAVSEPDIDGRARAPTEIFKGFGRWGGL